MKALKIVGYLIAAVAILTALFTSAIAIIIIGIAFGIILNLSAATFFTAGVIRKFIKRMD